MGKICDYDNRRVRSFIEHDANQNTRKTFFNAWDSILLATWFSMGFGLIYLLFVQCMPTCMNYLTIFGGGFASILLSVLIYQKYYYSLNYPSKWVIIVIILFFALAGIATIVSGFLRSIQMRINGVFLHHASLMIKQYWVSLLYFPFFLAIIGGLVFLTLFELFAFWSRLPPKFSPDSLYWLLQSDHWLVLATLCVIVQLIWGLNFIAQACKIIMIQIILLFQETE